METNKCISLGDSYIETEGDEQKVAEFIDDNLNEKVEIEMFTKTLPKNPVKLTKINLKKKTFKINLIYNINILDYYINFIYDMLYEKDFPYHCKKFLHTVDFVRLLQKTVNDTSALEVSDNNLCFCILNAKKVFMSVCLFD